jgi:hypothetical protein
MKNLLFLLILISLAACNKAGNDSQSATETQPTPQPLPAKAAGIDYPGLPVERAVAMFNECNYVDGIFYDLPISMSQNEKASIQQTISYISDSPATIYPNCAPIGRFFFQKDGDDMAVAEFYFSGQCYAFIFLEDGKPKYGNKLTDAGKAYFERILNSY